MSNEEMNTALYEKMSAEQGTFRDWLLTQPPEEILNHAYEYTVREDMVMAMENLDLSHGQAAVLLDSPSPLGDLYKEYVKVETDYMDTIRDCLENRADDMLKAQRELPIYQHPVTYAQAHDELEAYRISHKANVACKEAIEAAIAEHYRDNRLGEASVAQVVEQFGYDRTFYVLAATVRDKESDGRISRPNKEWARTVPVVEDIDDWNQNRNRYFVVDRCNPGLTDLFLKMARHDFLLTQPLTKEDIMQEAGRVLRSFQGQREPASPEGTQFMVQLSPDFLARAGSKDHDRLMKMLPFPSLSLSTLKDRPGVFAFIARDENRDQPLRTGRASVRDKLQKKPDAPKPAAPGKKKVQER